VQRHIPAIARQGRPFLHVPGEADPPRIRQQGAGPVVVAGTLTQTVQATVETDQGQEDDVWLDRLAVRSRLKQRAGARGERIAGTPGEKAHRLRRIGDMGQGNGRASGGGRRQDRRGIAFMADRNIAREDAAAANSAEHPVGQSLGDGGALALAEPGEEFRPPRTEQLAQIGLGFGVGGTTMAVCVNIL